MRTRSRVRQCSLSAAVFVTTLLGLTWAADTIQWKNIGPGGGGNIFATAVSPHDPNVVLTGSDVGGIFRSGDGGVTWKVVNDAIVSPSGGAGYGVYGTFAFHPTDPNIVYLGPMKSADAGQHWQLKVVSDEITAGITAIDPVDPQIVYAAGYANVYKSTCGWENPCPSGPLYTKSCLPTPGSGQTSVPGCLNYNDGINDLVMDPSDRTHLLVCANSGLYQSLDSATTWTQIAPTGLPHQQCNRMVVHAASRTLYLTLRTHTASPGPGGWVDIDSWQGGVYKSTNWGLTWTNASGSDEPNALGNAGFEVAGGDGNHPAANWFSGGISTVTRDCSVSHSGVCSIKVQYTSPENAGGVETDPCLPVVGGKLYKLSAWVKASNAAGFTAKSALVYYDAGGTPVLQPGSTFLWFEPFYYDGEDTYDWRRFEALVRPLGAVTCAKIGFGPAYGSGTVWMDDVSFRGVHTTPAVSGQGHNPAFVNYIPLAVDPLDVNTVYVGTERTFIDILWIGEVGGIWKSIDGGANWSHVTRQRYQDNVLDAGTLVPRCGNGLCEGRWETCTTCPPDCTGPGLPAPPACCGDNVCQGPAETKDNCLVDCPVDPDPNPRPYYELPVGGYGVWSIGIGSGTQGHNTLHFGAEHVRTIDGGATWVDVTSDLHTPTMGDPVGTWKARGETNDVHTYAAVTDSRDLNRLYYGDSDGFLKVSYNGGISFATEGWFNLPDVGADAPTAIVLDPVDVNTIYVAVANSQAEIQGVIGRHAVLRAIYDPSPDDGGVGRWTWSILGDLATFPPGGGGIDLLREDPSGNFFAAVYAEGVYKLANGSNTWTNTFTGSNWTPAPPTGWKTSRIVREPTSGRLYVGAGNPEHPGAPPGASETGVWESSDGGGTWRKITDTSTEMTQEPPIVLLPTAPNTLFVGTWVAGKPGCSMNPCPNYDGAGGLYKGTRDGGGNWAWTRVLRQPRISGLAVSPADSSILYAFAGQVFGAVTVPGQLAGIHRSLDGGNTWTLQANNGLMNLGSGQLSFSASDSHRLYAPTLGNGVFEGTIACADPVRDFVCATRISPAGQTVSSGSLISGALNDLSAGSRDDTYETFQEGGTSSKKKLSVIWTFTGASAGVSYRLRVEGFRNASANDTFSFSTATRTSGNCTGSESYGSSVVTVSKTSDDDGVQEGNAGILPSGSTVFCVKVADSAANDSQVDTFTLDRLYLLPLATTVATGEGNGGVGSRLSGTYVDTQAPDEQPTQATETLKEGTFGNSSALSYFWTFNLPAGSTYKLHFEGSRPDNPDGDNFKFRWATSTGGPWTDIPNAVISSPNEVPGGTDSSTFVPTGGSGTLYIYIKDTNSQPNKSSLDTVSIDHLAVLKVP